MTPKTLAVMIDCSRNGVMKPEKVKEFATIIKKMGYNALMLYTEDTYEVENEPYFGYMRGRYTIAEMQEMDAYCCSIGIELIPCIQVLAHLGHIPRWEEYWCHMDSQDVLLVGDERNYRLIENMLATLQKCFTSRRIHIGMDEAFYLGTGRYLQQNGYRDRLQIFVEHLNRVKQLTDQYGFQPMIWSDMFFHLVGEDKKLPPEILRQVPECVELVYWDYDGKEQKHYDENITAHKQFQNNKTAYAAAVWTCTGYAPNLRLSLDAADAAMRSVRENGIETVLVTMWGDDGKDCSYFAGLSGLFADAQMAKGNFDRQDIAEKFQNLFGYRFEEFMNLELANITAEEESHRHNPSKYLLFNDPFLGLLDYTVHDELKMRYAAAVKTVEASVNGREYDYLFDFQAKLLTLLTRKCDLGIRLRKAYQAQDKETLAKLLEEEFPPMAQETRNVYEAFRTLWDRENKSIGFELQEMRFGALMLRNESCARMLREYLEGARERIEELEAPMLPGHYGMEGKAESFNSYLQTISANSNAF